MNFLLARTAALHWPDLTAPLVKPKPLVRRQAGRYGVDDPSRHFVG